MTEESEKGTLHTVKEAIIPAIWLFPGTLALFPYMTQPVSYPADAGVWEFTMAGVWNVLGIIPYLYAHPWLALLTLPSLVYVIEVAIRRPRR